VIDDANPDLLIGAPRADPLGRWSAGAVYLVSGQALTRSRDLAVLGFHGIRLAGQSQDARAGIALAADVDVGGDQSNDLLIGTRPTRDATTAAGTILQRAAQLAKRPERTAVCDARPVSMILDASRGLAAVDKRELRGEALEMLLEHPSAEQRIVGAVEAAERPAQVFTPFVPGDLTDRGIRIADRLVDESVQRTAAPGDLTDAVATARRINREMLSALVVAGPDAIADPARPPDVPVDIVGVGIPATSQLNATLHDFAAASGGRYRPVPANRLQRSVARFDARRRCETPPSEVQRSSSTETEEQEFEATATIDEDRLFADVVITWEPGATPLEPYEVKVDEVDGNDGDATFDADDVEKAIDEGSVPQGNLTLVAGTGATFFEFRVDFSDEPEPPTAPTARAATHRRHRIYVGGGSRSPVDVHVQFFEPPPSD